VPFASRILESVSAIENVQYGICVEVVIVVDVLSARVPLVPKFGFATILMFEVDTATESVDNPARFNAL